MRSETTILIADDDEGHAGLIKKNLRRAGIKNETVIFTDGEEILNFLFEGITADKISEGTPYVLLLDIRMPKVDGIEVLKQINDNADLHNLPVIIFSTTDDPETIKDCYNLGCSCYIVKPVDYEKFIASINQIANFLSLMES